MKTNKKEILKTIEEISYRKDLTDTERLKQIREYCEEMLKWEK